MARPDQAPQKRRRRIRRVILAIVALGGATLALSRLKLAAPTVERIVLRPGALVEPERVILVLDNPEIEHAAANADSQLAAAEAELVHLKVQVQRDVLKMESTAANAKSNYEQARLRAEVNEKLFQQGLITELDRKVSDITAEAATACHAIEQKRVAFSKEMVAPQIAVKEAEVARSRAQARLRHAEQSALAVRAGMHGVLQLLPVEIGAQVQPGANIARVADHSRLKAEVRVAETQVKDIQISQLAWCSRRWSERRACCWPRHWARSCPSAAR